MRLNCGTMVLVLLSSSCAGQEQPAVVTGELCEEGSFCCPGSPIILDLHGDGITLTSWQDGVAFPLRPEYGPSHLSWTQPESDDAWLALDRNHDGLINDGSELFGNFTEQTPTTGEHRNGFVALLRLDDNLDGVVDGNDSIYSDLRLWLDLNHDGVSQTHELHPLSRYGINGLQATYSSTDTVDAHGNRFRYRGAVVRAQDSSVAEWAWDVFLTGTRPQAPPKTILAARRFNWGCIAACYMEPKPGAGGTCPVLMGEGSGLTEAAACQDAILSALVTWIYYPDCQKNFTDFAYPCSCNLDHNRPGPPFDFCVPPDVDPLRC
jgi:hypothetical protein